MAVGDVVIVRVPITLDADGSADTAVQTIITTLFTPVATYPTVDITIIPPMGTKTKGLLVASSRAAA